MSSIASWSYRNTATVTPFLGIDQRTQQELWGDSYEIACTWTGESQTVTVTTAGGSAKEYHAKNIIWTEDKRPARGDKIKLNAHGKAAQQEQIIQDVTEWDMSPFGEENNPDFRLVV